MHEFGEVFRPEGSLENQLGHPTIKLHHGWNRRCQFHKSLFPQGGQVALR